MAELEQGPSQHTADSAVHHMLAIADLPTTHRQVFRQGLANVLATEIAQTTFAQIIDGLPLSDVENDKYDGSISMDHPLHNSHAELCPGALSKADQLREEFDDTSLQFKSTVILQFAGVPLGSKLFQTHLIELIASAIHSIGADLHKLNADIGGHAHDGLNSWVPDKGDELWWMAFPNGAPPTLFQHAWYIDYEQYPAIVSDGVGYWAEARIFGGVVLFDRRDSSSQPDTDESAVYLHPDREEVTYRICKLRDTQKQALVEFLLSREDKVASPLPIIPDAENTIRIDPEEPIKSTGIYRDLWERKPLGPDMIDRRVRDVIDHLDWPSTDDWILSNSRANKRRFKLEYPGVEYD